MCTWDGENRYIWHFFSTILYILLKYIFATNQCFPYQGMGVSPHPPAKNLVIPTPSSGKIPPVDSPPPNFYYLSTKSQSPLPPSPH